MLSKKFRSARAKLTLFYLVIIAAFSLLLTWGVRIYAEHEYLRSNTVQRGEVHRLVINGLDVPGPRPEKLFATVQDDEASQVRAHLNQALIEINIAALTIGGVLSYWFASRTLKPLQDAHDAQTRFAADASHELRTPLANMQLENEIFLRQKHFSEAEARELIASNLEEVRRLEALSSNLLALTTYDGAELPRAPVDVAALTQAAQKQLQNAADAKSMTIQIELEPATVLCHEASLTQLLAILLDNAVKYGPQNGAVQLRGTTRGSQYDLSVADNGPGIPPADLPHIFDRLYRGDKARSSAVPGYGLGLALAKEIADANHAVITAANASDAGAVFTLSLERAG